MTKNIYEQIATRTNGDIYIGVVGPVRSGKSTFIKQFMEKAVLPGIEDESLRARARDELPQSASGKTVMTAEPKFVPENGAKVKTAGGIKMNVRMVDCVGYLVDGAQGFEENGEPRMVSTPWSEEKMEFSKAARLGTNKVMQSHSTVGVVVTTDGSIGEIPRESYAAVEGEIIEEMKKSEKPFVILVNSVNPHSEAAQKLGGALEEKYGVPVALVNCAELSNDDIEGILSLLLLEFPIKRINIDMPEWVCALSEGHPLRESIYRGVKNTSEALEKMSEVRRAFEMGMGEGVGAYFEDAEMDLSSGEATVKLSVPGEKYFEVLGELSGMKISSDAELFKAFKELAAAKESYDRVAQALLDVERKGYGIVMPSVNELTLKEPQIVKQAGGYGVRLRAAAKSIHMIKADIEAEVNPIVGSEAQSEELVRSITESLGTAPEKIWDTNMFGKSLYELVNEGLRTKLAHIPEDAQKRLSETLERVINEGSGGLICIIL
ncbi:MAG: stage IV sporulation protein A [Ruminococcaceae bacterium]|nr:stage IV sporulation protein A [Oscillospiraceae bacterium]